MTIIKLKCLSTPSINHDRVIISVAKPIDMPISGIETLFNKQERIIVEPIHMYIKEGSQFTGYLTKFRTDFETVSITLEIA
jgi:hypothetical protein